MIAGKRVPAAYRKNNRVSHLTADAVRQMGYIVEPSGQKLTIGRRNRQRGGGGSDDEGGDVRTVPQHNPSPKHRHASRTGRAKWNTRAARHLSDDTCQTSHNSPVPTHWYRWTALPIPVSLPRSAVWVEAHVNLRRRSGHNSSWRITTRILAESASPKHSRRRYLRKPPRWMVTPPRHRGTTHGGVVPH